MVADEEKANNRTTTTCPNNSIQWLFFAGPSFYIKMDSTPVFFCILVLYKSGRRFPIFSYYYSYIQVPLLSPAGLPCTQSPSD